MALKLEEVSDEVLEMNMKEFSELVKPATVHPPASQDRIANIMDRVHAETVMKDSAEFVAEGVGKGVLGIVDTMVCLGNPNRNPKRSY